MFFVSQTNIITPLRYSCLFESINKIFESMRDHSRSDTYFSSMIGFFYHHGIGTDIDSDKAVNSYLTAIKNEEEISKINFDLTYHNFAEDFYQLINVIIGKLLLSLFY